MNARPEEVSTSEQCNNYGAADDIAVQTSLNDFQRHLLNDWQRDLPLVSRPFDVMAHELKVSTDMLMAQLAEFCANGTVSRVGPVFRPNSVGASSLVAAAVAPARLAAVAAQVNAYNEVNHNYEREHAINLWFVVTAADKQKLHSVLDDIEQRIGLSLLRLPLLKDHHIDLGFQLVGHECVASPSADNSYLERAVSMRAQPDLQRLTNAATEALLAQIQGGLPLVERPYAAVAAQIGCTESQVISALHEWINAGVIKRLGVIVRHHELGYKANAMVVWNVPDADVDSLGEALGSESDVTLCYQRPRVAGRWPYNLFCMIHGHDKETVSGLVVSLVDRHALQSIPFEVLFSGRRFKQRGARYRQTTRTPINTEAASHG